MEGDIKENDVFDLVKNRAQNFINFNRYISAVPRQWKDILRTGEMGDVQEQDLLTLQLQAGEAKLGKCRLRDFCSLLADGVVKSNAEQYWEGVFGPLDWNSVYKIQQCKVLEQKIRDFRWKVVNKCLTTETKLKYFTDSNGLCKLCDLEMEDELHILSDCVSLEDFWSHLFKIMKNIFGFDTNICDDKLLICSIEQSVTVNVIVEEAKWQVWKRRCLIRYENVWITDAQLVNRLRNSLATRIEVLKRTKFNNEELVNQLTLFINVV